MSSVYFNSLSGMTAASFGLKTISNNVANMQSPGFKGSTVFYTCLGSGNNAFDNLGNGVAFGKAKMNFQQGNLQETGIKTQMAVDGEGFFIIQLKHGEYLYTRDGEFHFNKDGYLVDDHSDGFVMGYTESGQLTKISNKGQKTYPGSLTHEVDLKGTIVYEEKNEDDTTNDPTASKYKDVEFKVEVYDSQGKLRTLVVVLAFDDTPMSKPSDLHIKEIYEQGGDAQINFDSFQSLKFFSSGPDENYNKLNFSVKFAGLIEQRVKLNFGKYNQDPDSYVALEEHSSINDLSNIEVRSMDGYAEGLQYDYEFDRHGQINYLYSNKQSVEGIHIALAKFDNPGSTLEPTNNNAFHAKSNQGLHVGSALDDYFGNIVAQKLELSNVDSTNEFANIVILQRMFQSCSQLMEIDKQLLEDLYKK